MSAVDAERERERVLHLLEQHGWNATSFQMLEPGFRVRVRTLGVERAASD